MTFALILDLVLVLLLAATIGYCAAVHRRLGALRSEQGELRGLIDQFTESTSRAQESLDGLRSAAAESAETLGPQIAEAKTLIGDLDMLNHRAGKLVAKLDPAGKTAAKTPARKTAPNPGAKGKRPVRGKAGSGGPVETPPRASVPSRSQTERDLIEALKATA